VPKKVSK